jgi:peptide-methionine (S)-S-oxide reductase
MKIPATLSAVVASLCALMIAGVFSSCGVEEAKSPEAPPAEAKESVETAPVEAAPVETAPETVKEAPATEPVVAVEPKVADSAVPPADVNSSENKPMKEGKALEQGKDSITLGGGCFWCTEAVMERLEGVSDVVSGYMGGHVENPTYEQIGTKTTGHVEVIEVTFDPAIITLDELLDVFWQAHDPTTMDQQGADRGPQYRSVIFYHSPEQRNIATQSMQKLNESGMYSDPAVTEIREAAKFWVAEDYHQNYYELNKDKNPYCRVVISPKLKKLGME